METNTSHPPGVPAGGPSPGPGPSGPVGAAPASSTPEQRERWRRKAKLAYERKKLREGKGDPAAVASLEQSPIGPAPGVCNPPVPPAPGLAPVPWTPDLLRPLFEATVPEVEKLDVASLKAKAAEIDNGLAVVVEKDAAWNPVAKATICTTGPVVVANAMNSFGVSAEHAPAVALAAAIGSIITSRALLARKLEQLAAERRPLEKRPGPDVMPSAPGP